VYVPPASIQRAVLLAGCVGVHSAVAARRLALMTATPSLLVTSSSARRVNRPHGLVDCRSGHSVAPPSPYVAGIASGGVTADVGGGNFQDSARAHRTTSARGANSPRNPPRCSHPRQRRVRDGPSMSQATSRDPRRQFRRFGYPYTAIVRYKRRRQIFRVCRGSLRVQAT